MWPSTSAPSIIKDHWIPVPAPKVTLAPRRRPQQHDPPQGLGGAQRQAFHAIRLASEVGAGGCGAAQGGAGPDAGAPAGQDRGDLPHSRGIVQPGLQRDHPRGHHQFARTRPAAHAGARLAHHDPRGLPDALPVVRELRHAEGAVGRGGHGGAAGVAAGGGGGEEPAAGEEGGAAVEEGVAGEEDLRAEGDGGLRARGLAPPDPGAGERAGQVLRLAQGGQQGRVIRCFSDIMTPMLACANAARMFVCRCVLLERCASAVIWLNLKQT